MTYLHYTQMHMLFRVSPHHLHTVSHWSEPARKREQCKARTSVVRAFTPELTPKYFLNGSARILTPNRGNLEKVWPKRGTQFTNTEPSRPFSGVNFFRLEHWHTSSYFLSLCSKEQFMERKTGTMSIDTLNTSYLGIKIENCIKSCMVLTEFCENCGW